MPLTEIIGALVFVLSSGLLFHERYRKNQLLIIGAGVIALASSYFLFEEISRRMAIEVIKQESTPRSTQNVVMDAGAELRQRETDAWLSAEGANTIASLRAYVMAYPSGLHANLAASRMSDLRVQCISYLKSQHRQYISNGNIGERLIYLRGVNTRRSVVSQTLTNLLGIKIGVGYNDDASDLDWVRRTFANGCIGYREDQSGTLYGAQCIADLLGGQFFVENESAHCRTDGFPYNLIVHQ
jgi:hypothetical protein